MFTDFWTRVVTRIERAVAEEPYVLDLTGCLPPIARMHQMTRVLMHVSVDEMPYDAGKRQERERDGAQP